MVVVIDEDLQARAHRQLTCTVRGRTPARSPCRPAPPRGRQHVQEARNRSGDSRAMAAATSGVPRGRSANTRSRSASCWRRCTAAILSLTMAVAILACGPVRSPSPRSRPMLSSSRRAGSARGGPPRLAPGHGFGFQQVDRVGHREAAGDDAVDQRLNLLDAEDTPRQRFTSRRRARGPS